MSIGETLAQARRWAGLTVTEVSQRTRIRETLVKDIERDDYSACGGDFYTRGHIRAIARVVGADPEPLIDEYDAARRAASTTVADTVPQFPAVRTQGWPQRQSTAPGGPHEDPPPRRRQTPAEPPPGAPLRIRPDHPGGWQEPPRAAAASAPPDVTPDWAGGQPPPGIPAADVSLVPPDRDDGWREPPRDPADVPRHTPEAGGQPSVMIPAAGAPLEAAPDPSTRWQQHHELTRQPAAGGPYQSTPANVRGRRRNGPAMFGLVLLVVLGFLGWYFVYGSGTPGKGTPAAGGRPSAGASQPAHGGGAAHRVVVRLTAVRASSVVFTTSTGKYLFRARIAAGASRRWTFRQPVTMRLANAGGVRLLVDGKNPLPAGSAHAVTLNLSPGHPATVAHPGSTPTPSATHSPAVPITASVPLTPASATSFGMSGAGQGDNQAQAPLAIDHSSSTSWNTDWYASARFGNLYPGTGLLLDMGRPVTITGAEISLGSAPGATFDLRVGSAPTMAVLPTVARASGASGVVRLRLTTPAQGRYVLIWFTRLPLSSNGNFEASVYNVRLQGHV